MLSSSTHTHTLRTASLYFIYVYSFSFVNAIFIGYGMEDISLTLEFLLRGIFPSIMLVGLIFLTKPYTIILEALFYVWATIWNIITIFQALSTKSIVDTPSLYIMMITTGEETKSFLKMALSFELLLILIVTIFLPLAIWYLIRKNVKQLPNYIRSFCLILVSVIIMLVPITTKTISSNKIEVKLSNIDRNIRRAYFVQYATLLPKAILMGRFENYIPENVNAKFKGAQNVILIVLESANRNNFSLYGYERKTNPELEKLDLTIYEDVISPAAVTVGSLPYMYTFATLQKNEKIVNIYDLFRAAGFKTYLFEGFPTNNPNDLMVMIANRADQRFIRQGLDSSLFSQALSVLDDKNVEKKLLVIQTMASHFVYSEHYAEEFEVFSGTPPNLYPNSSAKNRNEYDNSILYLDSIVSEFINNIDKNEDTIVIITTDHGEEVGHYAANHVRSSSSSYLSCYEIPFILYSSASYKNTLGDLVFDTKRPFQTDNLLHSLLDLAHIEVSHFNPELSLFNKAYKEQIRTIRGNEYNAYKAKVDKEREENINK